MSNLSDRELLELAAKAAGMPHEWLEVLGGMYHIIDAGHMDGPWNPLRDDGQALRLAVNLGLQIIPRRTFTGDQPIAVAAARWADDLDTAETYYDGDPAAATRRAITRAAAEIGRQS